MYSQGQWILKGFLILLVTFTWPVTFCAAYNILVVFLHPMTSHMNLGDAIVRHLLNAGHQVTYISPNEEMKNTVQENLTHVDVSITKSVLDERFFNLNLLMSKQAKIEQNSMTDLCVKIWTLALEDENVKKLMEDPKQQFDLVIAEWMINERNCGFAAVFNCPFLWLFAFEPNFLATRLIDEHTNLAYTANLVLDIQPPYSFLERVRNLWFQLTYTFKQYYYYDDMDRKAFKEIFQPAITKKYGHHVEYDELKYNASLVLSISHSSLGHAIRAPANMISIGGYHIDDDNIAFLPNNLKSIMDNSKYGVIYFSMGSVLKSSGFPRQILKDLTVMFSKLKQTVLWKYEGELMNCSENVHVLRWVPQQSILAHPNCILFITHGGMLSTTEAIHFGEPIIGIPVFFDQFTNVGRAVKKGFEKIITLSLNLADDLNDAINDILVDSTYKLKVKEASYMYLDRPVPPGKELVHWVEHVVATGGAPHLRSSALLVPWYQKIYMDLAAFVALVVLGAYVFLKYVLKLGKRKLSQQNKKFV